jgi:hypothetical protein
VKPLYHSPIGRPAQQPGHHAVSIRRAEPCDPAREPCEPPSRNPCFSRGWGLEHIRSSRSVLPGAMVLRLLNRERFRCAVGHARQHIAPGRLLPLHCDGRGVAPKWWPQSPPPWRAVGSCLLSR